MSRSEYLYGRNAVHEALHGRRRHRLLLVAEGTERHGRVQELIALAQTRRVEVRLVPRRELDRLLGPVNHQGIALETSSYPYVHLDQILNQGGGRPILVLDHLQDPQNLATLLRTAEAVGVAGVLLPERRAAGVTPAVVNASAGAVEHLRIAQVVNLARAVDQARDCGYWVLALEPGPGAQSLFEADIPTPALLIVGSEGSGMSPVLLKRADLQVALPMRGRVTSLNAAVAGSIALYELLRRETSSRDTSPLR
ncbi:Putative TrmH family tRNA/rRNA methyltransferase [bacterium HR26]|nr:Putative TrmH family tRNA/rRNA methyltransferase [bacterium HR26]